MLNRHLMILVLVIVALLGPALRENDASEMTAAAIDFVMPEFDFSNDNWCLGFEFTTNSEITVTHLGLYDDLKDGLTESHAVGIFDASGRLMVMGTVRPEDPLEGWFRYTSVTPTTLQAGQTFIIAAVTGFEKYTWQPEGFTVDPSIRFVTNRFVWGGELIYPTETNGPDADPAVFGPNLKIAVAGINEAPTLTADHDTVTVNEGETAYNTGHWADGDGDAVTLAASVGTVEQVDDAWTWSFATTDGPVQSQTVNITADDSQGGVSVTSFSLIVSNAAPVVGAINAPGDAVKVAAAINIVAPFSDPGILDTHTAVWDWGDGTTSSVAVSEAKGSGTVSGSHSYASAGVYTVLLTVEDSDGDKGTAFCQVVVYDPVGFVTGKGWINSPTGAWMANPSIKGKATFSVLARYRKGKTAPEGKVTLQFPRASLNFNSMSCDWLVVGENRAQLMGKGTVNGTGSFGFLLAVIDGKGTKDPDRLHIKIWNRATGAVIYDNEPGISGPITPISGGNIAIYTR